MPITEPQTPTAPTTAVAPNQNAPSPLPTTPFKGSILSGALIKPGDPVKLIINTIPHPTLKDVFVLDVDMQGPWDGRLVKGAIRTIEWKYKHIKHNMTRMAIQKANAEKAKQEALKQPVITKGV